MSTPTDRKTSATSERFGYLHGSVNVNPQTDRPRYHLAVMQEAVDAPPLRGRVLDAGCGDGVDLASTALSGDATAVGVELSEGGIRTSAARTRGNSHAHLVRGNLCWLPFRPGSFDAAYSYGVLHHTADPPRAAAEVARALKPGAPFLFYVYEDLSDRSATWRAALALVTSIRRVTTKLPPATLMACCRLVAPLVYATCTWPSRRFRWARRFPYHHCRTVRSIVPDLYDRMAAPLEYRYSREGAAKLAENAGLRVTKVAQVRGWVVLARKPLS